MSYCQYVKDLNTDNVHRYYHDNEYGFPLLSDNELFGRLTLEIFQAGLNWTIILNKKKNFEEAFDGFIIDKVAKYQDEEIADLLNNKGIIRNKLKINATIYNAQAIQQIQKENGSFYQWLVNQGDIQLSEWVKRFKKKFKFVGNEIVNEFLMSSGIIEGAHDKNCEVYHKIQKLNPIYSRKK